VPFGVALSTGAPVGASGMGPAVGSGEGAAEGEVTSHPANSVSARSNTDSMRKQFFIDLPSDLFSDARHSSALLNDCQGDPNPIIKATLEM
jgi:hypothetical protein